MRRLYYEISAEALQAALGLDAEYRTDPDQAEVSLLVDRFWRELIARREVKPIICDDLTSIKRCKLATRKKLRSLQQSVFIKLKSGLQETDVRNLNDAIVALVNECGLGVSLISQPDCSVTTSAASIAIRISCSYLKLE